MNTLVKIALLLIILILGFIVISAVVSSCRADLDRDRDDARRGAPWDDRVSAAVV